MQRQGSFAEAEYAGQKKQTRRDKFLADMEAVVPWSRLVEGLAPLYPKGERGRGWGGPGPPYTQGPNVAGRRSRWNACCGSILCSNGMGWLTKRSRMRSMTARRCAALPASR